MATLQSQKKQSADSRDNFQESPNNISSRDRNVPRLNEEFFNLKIRWEKREWLKNGLKSLTAQKTGCSHLLCQKWTALLKVDVRKQSRSFWETSWSLDQETRKTTRITNRTVLIRKRVFRSTVPFVL